MWQKRKIFVQITQIRLFKVKGGLKTLPYVMMRYTFNYNLHHTRKNPGTAWYPDLFLQLT